MQVTQCDRCGELPIEGAFEEMRPVDRGADGISQYGVIFSVRAPNHLPDISGKRSPDLCKRCFWILVNEGIEAFKSDPVRPA